jgi:putative membrane protein
MILREKGLDNKFWSFYVFFLSGILGLLVLNMPNLSQPLFPMLSGLFGVSTLIVSLSQRVEIPKQRVTEMIYVNFGKKLRALSAAVFSGSLTGIFPGLGAAQASVIGMELVGNIGIYGFMILIGGINTVNFVFSLATFYTLEKARNGAIVAVMEIIKSINLNELIVFLAAALIAGGFAVFLALFFTRIFSKLISLVDYKILAVLIIFLISVLSFVFGNVLGLVILGTSTFIGILPPLIGVKRSHSMGCLLLPVILFFVL